MSDLTSPAGKSPNAAGGALAAVCAECAAPFAGRRASARFCGDQCRKRFNNRNLAQGGPLVPLLKAWRLARNVKSRGPLGAECLSELVSIVDAFIVADRADGRTSEMTLDYARAQLAGGARYIDRARPKPLAAPSA